MQIVLIRHGKPDAAVNPRLTASGFAHWVRTLNKSAVRMDSVPPANLAAGLEDFFVVASDLPRARHSAERCVGRSPDLSLAVLREMEIPRFRLPVKMRAWTWVYVNRTLWMLGGRGNVESFREAKVRVHRAARRLDLLARDHERLVVFGHSVMNRYLSKQLLLLGWHGDRPRWAPYWGAARFEKTAEPRVSVRR